MRGWLMRYVSPGHAICPGSLILFLLALSSAANAAPSISSLSPTSGPVGTSVTISGSGFGSSQGSSTVKFNGTTATASSWRSSSITVPVPTGATTGNVVVTVSGNASNGVAFTVVAPPAISGLSPTSGAVGTVVTISGTNFGATQGSSTVTFNGTTASPTSWSATSIKAPVPSGASTGNVVVTAGGVSSGGVSFTVVAAPSISSLSPTSGTAGTSVTISGSNFGSSQGSSTLTFNGIAASPTSWRAGTIKAPVPTSATTGNVVVTVSGVASNGVNFTVTATPTITSLSPTSGPVGAAVTISGTNFGATQGSSTVTFSGTTATPTSWSATSIVAPVPSGASTGNVVVTVGGVKSSGVSFTVVATPTISSLSPTSGAVGTSVTISGSKFGSSQGSSTVTFNGTAGSPTSWGGSTIKVPVPANATTGNVVVTVNGVASNGVSFTVPSTAPTISSLSPTSGAAGVSVTITGTNFGSSQGSSTVTFNGTVASPSSWSATSIKAPVPAGATTGNVVVTVSAKASNGVSFTVLPTPSITGLSPSSGPIGTAVTITGTNFGASQGGSTVTLNGTSATSFTSWSAGSIVTAVPAGATTGNVVVTVGGVASNGVSFTVLLTPGVTSLAPTSGAVGTSVTITGVNFGASQGSSTVTFNGLTSTPTSWSATSIKAPVPAGASTGNVVVTVAGVASNGVSFTVLPTPSITGLSPVSGPVGTAVTISGTNFGATQGSSTVTFNGTIATSITSWSATSIVAAVPAGATTGNVVVAVSGVASNAASFTVLAMPGITSLSPTSGPVGASVTIAGANFGSAQGTSTVTFNGTAATAITSWSIGSIIAAVPTGATTGNVVVTVNGVASNGASFTVLPTPSITNLSPTSGPAGTAVTITGTNFGPSQGNSTVTFNGTPATAIASWSAGSIIAAVPVAATTGNVVVTVSGVQSSGVSFTVLPTPGITSLTPNSGPLGASITIAGVNFGSTQNDSTVTFNGVSSTPTSWSATSIAIPVPASATTGNVVITVGGVPSNGMPFTVLPTPSITGLSPTSGPVGTPVTITGTNFGAIQGLSTVTFNGTPSTAVTNWSVASIVAAVPAAAATGYVVVTVSGVPSTGMTFTVLPTPGITSLSPASARVGDSVTITGANFGSTQGNSTVTFNGTAVTTITSWSAGSIVTAVPAGASTGNVVVTVNGVASNGASFTVLPPSFAPTTAGLGTARYGHAAIRLTNGKVLVTGGTSGSGALNSAELYDPASQSFGPASAGPTNSARQLHTATLLNNGQVLIVGGLDASGAALNSAELYDPIAQDFNPVTSALNTARAGHTATLLGNGQVLIVGGYDPASSIIPSAELYDPATQSFISLGNTGTPRFGHTATLLQNGQVLITGGKTDLTPSGAYNSAEIYGPATRSFTSLSANMTSAREGHAATVLNSGQVLITGGDLPGTGSLSSAELYDPSTGKFTAISAAMTAARVGHTALLLNGGQVLITGGATDSSSGSVALNTAEIYDPSGPSFQAIGNMTSAREGQTATLLNDGTVLEAGGTDGSNVLNSGELYVTSLLTGLTSITISPAAASVPLGTQQLFTATGTFSNSGPQILSSVIWSSSAPNISVNNDASDAGFAASVTQGAATLTASAAGISGSTLVTVSAPALVSITVSPQSPVVPLGTPQQFTATGTYTDGSTQDITATATWASLSQSVAAINAGGLAATLAQGATTIKASSGSISVTTTLTVTPAVLLSVMVTPSQATIPLGTTQQFRATAFYTDGSSADVTSVASWSSSSGGVAEVDASGLATSLAQGPTGITAIFNAVPGNASLTVGPPALLSIAVAPGISSLAVGGTQQFTATGTYSDGSTQDVTASSTWASSNTGVANFPSTPGLASALASGNSTITATSGSASSNAILVTSPATKAASLNTSRYLQSATILNNGQILVAGGVSCPTAASCSYLNSAELYDPVAGTFAYTGSLAMARAAPAVLLGNGKVLVAGGYACDGSGNCASLSAAELYDSNQGSFSSAGNMTTPRSDHTVTLLPNGTVLIAGGQNCTSASVCTALNSAEIYDPNTGAFTPVSNQMNSARFGASAVLLNQGLVLISGGFDGSSILAATEIYDPVAGSFATSTPGLNVPRFGATSTLLNNGQVLVAGGSKCAPPGCPVNAAELYDPVQNIFNYVGGNANNMLDVARFDHTATLLTNGQVLLAGGFSACATSCTSEPSTELFDPVAGTFTSGQVLGSALAGHTATLLSNGDALLIGGINAGATLANDEWYQPASLTPPGLVSIALTPAMLALVPGQAQQLSALGKFSDGSTQTLQSVSWDSFNTAVAGVSNSPGSGGTVNAVSAGSSTLVATAGNVGGSATASVAVLLSLTVTPSNPSVTVGTSMQFTATGTFSGGSNGNLTQAVTWEVNGMTGGNSTVGTVSGSGVYTAPLIVPNPAVVTVTAVSAANPVLPGSTQLTIVPVIPVSVSVSPLSANLDDGGTVQFTASVLNTSNTAVTWQVNGTTGGTQATGLISPSGYYAAPATVASLTAVTVTAITQADTTKSASVPVTINPVIVQVAPEVWSLGAGGAEQFTATVQNTSNTGVTWQVNGVAGGSSDTGTISTSGVYATPSTVASQFTVTVTAVSQVDPSQSASAQVTVNSLPVSISVSPLTATVNTSSSQPFTATVLNTDNTGVTWQVNGVTGGSAATGTIDSTGLYSAPAAVPSPAVVTVTAVSQADSTKSASAQVTIQAAFYVSTAGNDSNPGTITSPWRTIQHAASTVAAGSIVYVRAGTYNESVTIGVSGSAAAGPVIFQSYPGETAVVDGTGLTPPSDIHGLFNITNQSYVTIQGFEVRNYATSSSSAYPAGIWVTGAGSNVQILNNLVHNITTSSEKNGSAYGIAVYGTSGTASIDSINISGNQVYSLKTGESESVNVDGNVTNFAITNNIVHDNDNIGIDAIGFEGVAPSSSVDYARNGVITGNTVYNISAINNAGEGKSYDADGIYVDGGSQILIERNLVYNDDIGIEMASEHSGHVSSYVIARNNLVYNSNSVGITIGGYSSSVGGTDHCTIVNNTLYDNDTKSTGSGEFQIQYKATNNIFENNIVYASSQGLIVYSYTSAGSSPTVVDYNLYFSPLAATAAKFVWSGTTRTGFATYQSATGEDSHSQYADPQFLSLTTPNLQVQPSSPAVNAGINLGAAVDGTLDFAGNPRVAGANIDIGAYEQ